MLKDKKFFLSSYTLFLFIAGAPMLGFSKSKEKITKVVISDSQFKLVKEITDPKSLASFAKYWSSKIKMEPSGDPPGGYKIDILQKKSSDTKNQRYLYDETKGTLRVLTKTMTPEYKIENLNNFNDLIGLKTSK